MLLLVVVVFSLWLVKRLAGWIVSEMTNECVEQHVKSNSFEHNTSA